MKYHPKNWTYGAEFEFADYDRTKPLPKHCENNRKDHTIVNSSGIANDPLDKLYHHGGEVNTPPTDTIDGQVECLEKICKLFPEVKVNYRSNLHVHIRVPGLRDDLQSLKRVQQYIHQRMPKLLESIEPIPCPSAWEYKGREYEGAMRRYKRRKVSHHTLLSAKRVQGQLAAKTVDQFFEAEVPHRPNGTPCWHLQPRCCVSLRQLLESDTIEWRHFPGTLNSDELESCIDYCKTFLVHALEDIPLEPKSYPRWCFPKFPKYVHWQEIGYRATVHDGSLQKEVIANNIKAILEGRFEGFNAYYAAL